MEIGQVGRKTGRMIIKCKGCNKVLKQKDLEYTVGNAVIVDQSKTTLSNSGVIEPFCNECIVNLLSE